MNTNKINIKLIVAVLLLAIILPLFATVSGVYANVSRTELLRHANTYGYAVNSNSTVRDLAVIFENCIIPLLQEYFYDDYEKIRLVLGDNNKQDDKLVFVKATATDNVGLFGNVSFDFDETFTYEINEKAFDEIDSYKSI